MSDAWLLTLVRDVNLQLRTLFDDDQCDHDLSSKLCHRGSTRDRVETVTDQTSRSALQKVRTGKFNGNSASLDEDAKQRARTEPQTIELRTPDLRTREAT